MWDLKLYFIDCFLYLNFFISDIFYCVINFINPFIQNGIFLFNFKICYFFPQNLTFFFAIKFCLCIAFLILIRGGTPRYRYDYLTKLGWLKFLSFTILIFIISLLFFFILNLMKFEHFLSYFFILFENLSFFINLFLNYFLNFSKHLIFNWKILNYADGYWFIYSNKKFMYENRYF